MGFTKRIRASMVLLVAGISASASAQELLPIEVYGALPEISLMAISPSGNLAGMRIATAEGDFIAAMDLSSGQYITAADATRVNPRSLQFANDDNLILTTSSAYKSVYVRSAYQRSTAFIFNVKDGKIRRPMDDARNLYPHQGGLGQIVGRSTDGESIFMPAYIGERSGNPTFGFYRVDFDRRVPRRQSRGSTETIDWFLNEDGTPLLREDFDNRRNLHQLWRIDGNDKVLLFEEETDIRRKGFEGLTADRSAVIFSAQESGSDVFKYYRMDIETGDITGPIFGRDDVDVEHTLTDMNRIVLGVRYTGFLPTYQFLDDRLDERVRAIQSRLEGTYAELIDWSDDYDRLLFYINGPWSSGNYLLFQGDDSSPANVGSVRPAVTRDYIAPVQIIEYQARDGLTIPALLTATMDVLQSGEAPLIVMPHGGPEAHDEFEFNYRAQYFASRGYVVLQPQFRGSTGFGIAHQVAGRGEWGRKMQTDLDDGVDFLVQQGVADPDRVCMVGASYGGYAALAAGAFAPDKYKCIVSVAGVSDLPEMLKDTAREAGRDHWVVSYWAEQFGSESGKEFMKSISPVNHAEKFQAPVLLIHGRDDTVVPRDQSKRMERALKRAGKDVEYIILKGEDHHMSNAETRLAALKATAKFIEEHL